MYIPDHAEYIPGKGSFVHYRNYMKVPGDLGDVQSPPFPQRNVSPEEAVFATNIPKRNLMCLLWFITSHEARPFIGLFAVLPHKGKILTKLFDLYNKSALPVMFPFYREEGYYSEVVQEINKAVRIVLIGLGAEVEVARQTAENIGCMFEFDWAYRFPFQDICGETNKEKLKEDLPKEAERLILILQERDKTTTVTGKFATGLKALKLLWKIPKYRNIFRQAIDAIDLKKCEMDEGEIYHSILYGPYDTKGRNLEERLKLYETYHGEGRTKWPPRVIVGKQ